MVKLLVLLIPENLRFMRRMLGGLRASCGRVGLAGGVVASLRRFTQRNPSALHCNACIACNGATLQRRTFAWPASFGCGSAARGEYSLSCVLRRAEFPS